MSTMKHKPYERECEMLEHAAKHLPDGWKINIQVRYGARSVIAICPDGVEVDMHEDDVCIADQILNAVSLSVHEELVNKMDSKKPNERK
jgi:hypothetical protein